MVVGDIFDPEESKSLKENEENKSKEQTTNGHSNGVKQREEFELEKNHFVAEINDDEDTRCGFGPFRPEWIQRFASKKSFMVVFSFLAVVQTMCWAYFSATITTMEKRFKISSQTAGIVMTGNEISQILFSLFLSYFGSKGHRPRWIAVGILFSAVSCFILASPHAIYGPGKDALSFTAEYAHEYGNEAAFNTSEIAGVGHASKRSSRVQTCNRNAEPKKEECEIGDISPVPLILIFLSQFVLGIGVLLFFSLGGPYLDDNIKKTKSPMMFGITMCLRLIGPTLGFLFASYCLKIYISPGLTPLIKVDHPQWLGAWWLGWVVLGVLMIITSFFIALFPKTLPRGLELKKQAAINATLNAGGADINFKKSTSFAKLAGSQMVFTSEIRQENKLPTIKELPRALGRLLKNKVNVFNQLAAVSYLFAMIGYWTYKPKYMETIFMQTAVNAAIIAGLVSIGSQAIGLLISGWVISKYQPKARTLALWNVVINFLYIFVLIGYTQMGCNTGNIVIGEANTEYGGYNLDATCNAGCNCRVNKIFPVCYKDENKVFYSACHAGCSYSANETLTDCSCLPSTDSVVNMGACSTAGCFKAFMAFLALGAAIRLLDSSGRIGNMLVGYRCVHPDDKSMAVGLGIFLISIFAMLPGPIVFGAIYDSACLVWGTKCGKKGNCWLYDGNKLRWSFNLTAAVFVFIGLCFDILVWYYVKDLDLYDEDKNVQRWERERKEKQKKSIKK